MCNFKKIKINKTFLPIYSLSERKVDEFFKGLKKNKGEQKCSD